jgi:putative oxidoreductase
MVDFQKLAMPLGRFLISILFILSGFGKISAYAATQGYMEAMGVPGVLLPIVILAEIGAGAAIIIGWQTRLMALALAGYCVLSAIFFHADFSDPNNMNHFMKNIALTGGFLFLMANGAGEFSMENRNAPT